MGKNEWSTVLSIHFTSLNDRSIRLSSDQRVNERPKRNEQIRGEGERDRRKYVRLANICRRMIYLFYSEIRQLLFIVATASNSFLRFRFSTNTHETYNMSYLRLRCCDDDEKENEWYTHVSNWFIQRNILLLSAANTFAHDTHIDDLCLNWLSISLSRSRRKLVADYTRGPHHQWNWSTTSGQERAQEAIGYL